MQCRVGQQLCNMLWRIHMHAHCQQAVPASPPGLDSLSKRLLAGVQRQQVLPRLAATLQLCGGLQDCFGAVPRHHVGGDHASGVQAVHCHRAAACQKGHMGRLGHESQRLHGANQGTSRVVVAA